jgi:hypothetical protein
MLIFAEAKKLITGIKNRRNYNHAFPLILFKTYRLYIGTVPAHPGSPAFSNVFQNPAKITIVTANTASGSMIPLALVCNGTIAFSTDTINWIFSPVIEEVRSLFLREKPYECVYDSGEREPDWLPNDAPTT